MTKAKLYFTEGDPQEINNLELQNLIVSGITTLGHTTVTSLTVRDIYVSGVSTLGLVYTTDILAQNLNISGVSTFTDGPILIGSATSTGTELQTLQVTGGSYVSGSIGIGTTRPSSNLHVIGDSLIVGISTFGLTASTSPELNSQMSFELTNDTTLTIRVRGSDGVVRTGIVTLS
jgi:hypothetical protein